MVLTITAPLWADISDRPIRKLGIVYSPMIWWSRHGFENVSLLDDFEGTLNWIALDGAVTKTADPRYVHDGDAAMKMVTGITAGDVVGATLDTVPLDWRLPYSALELWFCLSAVAAVTPRDFEIHWELSDRDRANTIHIGLRYYNYDAGAAKNKWQYLNSAGVWADFAPAVTDVLNITTPQFNHITIRLSRAPGANFVYDQIQLNDLIFPMAGIGGFVEAYVKAGQHILLETTTDLAAATTVYIDSLIITSDTAII